METMNAIAVKVSYGGDLRRFSISKNPTYSQLLSNVVQVCGIDPLTKVVLKYADNEEEQVTMSSDVELSEAIKVSPALLRVFVTLPGALRAPTKNAASAPSAPSDMDIEDVSAAGLPAAPSHPFPPGWGFGPRGGRGGRGFRGHPYGFGGRGGFHGHDHPNAHAHPHPHPPHAHPHHGPHHDPHAHHQFYAPGEQIPAGGYERHRPGKDMMKDAKKEWKKELKNQWKEMSKEDRHRAKEELREMKKLKHHQKHRESGESEGYVPKLVARHVKDITISDGTELPAGSRFVKTWRIRNDGAEAWPAGCRLFWISRKGDRMGAPDEGVPLANPGVPVPPDSEVEVSVELVAPIEPGRYTSYWRMITPDGAKFGQRMWTSITVTGTSSSSSSSDENEFLYGAQATMIESMGFQVKRKHIIRLLSKKDGDVDKVVKVLSKREKGCKGKKF